ncbi:hypothetical protein BDR06DRAFT_956666 [Suillus hirtellus]|nr:hypothetical protein BDR06DRAFT_956666 [Suillus hirtellus]
MTMFAASVGSRQHAKIWDAKTGKLVAALETDWVWCRLGLWMEKHLYQGCAMTRLVYGVLQLGNRPQCWPMSTLGLGASNPSQYLRVARGTIHHPADSR